MVPSSRSLVVAFVVALIALAAAMTAYRFHLFHDVDLRGDQAAFTVWVQELHGAERLLPVVPEGTDWLTALEADERSLLHVILKPIYTGHQHLFVTFGLLFYVLVTGAMGAHFEAQVLTSILTGGLALAAAGLFPLLVRGAARRFTAGKAVAVGVAAACLMALSSFLHVFSAFSIHNFAVAMMLLALAANAVWLGGDGDGDRRRLVVAVVVSLAAIHSYHVNVFLVPTATVLAALATTRQPWRRRLHRAVVYSGWILLGFLPAIALVVITAVKGLDIYNKQDFSELLIQAFGDPYGYVARIPDRIGFWFEFLDMMYSLPGILLGTAGLAVLALRHGVALPLVVVVLHFLLGVWMPIFAQYDRTGAYVLPLFSIGCGVALVVAVGWIRRAGAAWQRAAAGVALVAVVAGLVGHLRRDLPRFVEPAGVHYWGRTLASRGRQQMIVDEVDALLPANALLVSWNTALGNQYQALSRRPGAGDRVFKPLDLLGRRLTAAAYLVSTRQRIGSP